MGLHVHRAREVPRGHADRSQRAKILDRKAAYSRFFRRVLTAHLVVVVVLGLSSCIFSMLTLQTSMGPDYSILSTVGLLIACKSSSLVVTFWSRNSARFDADLKLSKS